MTARAARAWLGVRMTGWAVCLPALTRRVPLAALSTRLARSTGAGRDSAAVIRLSRLIHRAVWLRRRDNCLERSLLALRYLDARDRDVRLVIGASEDGRGHVWVTIDGRPIHDDPETLEPFTPVTSFSRASRTWEAQS